MIWDCFTFFNEYELLEIRLNELDDVVDRFVICEATRTFAGKPKPLYYADAANRPEFRRFRSKIVHIVVNDMPTGVDRWWADFHQRDQIARVWHLCHKDDIILVSDADEISRPSAVREAADRMKRGFFRFKFMSYYYYLNCYRGPWNGTMAARASTWRMVRAGDYLRWKGVNPVDKTAKWRRFPIIRNGGWHFSYLGGPARIAEKIHAWAHSEHDTPKKTNLDTIRRHIDAREDLYGRPGKYCISPLNETFPAYVLANQERFKHLIREP